MMSKMRELITEKVLEDADDGNFVFSPFGIWAVFAMSNYTFDEVLENLGMGKEDAFSFLEEMTKNANNSDELSVANLIWAENSEWLSEIPKSDVISAESAIPSQEKADAIVEEFTKGLIDKYPGDLSGVILAFTNIITMILEWDKPFKVFANSDEMSFWKVDEVMRTDGSQDYNETVGFVRDSDSNLFAVFQKYSSKDSKVISVVSTDSETRKESALRLAQDIVEGKIKPIAPMNLFVEEHVSSGDNFEISKVYKEKDSYSVKIPAWELDSTLLLNDLFVLPSDSSMIQKCVAKYQVEGFKAAAVTGMMMRSAMIMSESFHVDVKFDKPFTSAAVYSGNSEWAKIPAFISWTETAVEPKIEDKES